LSMDSIEVSARNVNDAIQQALAQLGVTAEQAEVVVVHEGSRGILGIGAEDARVRVTRRAALARIPARPRQRPCWSSPPPWLNRLPQPPLLLRGKRPRWSRLA
jgi:hypothetical protein